MNLIRHILTMTLLASALFVLPALASGSLSQLEQQLQSIDRELETLASYTLRGGTGAFGYRSGPHERSDHAEWIRVELGEKSRIDQITLVPALVRDPKTGLRGEGFPVAFRILAGTSTSTNTVTTFTSEDQLTPRIAPLSIPIEPIDATWITLEATVLSSRVNRDLYVLNMSEILVFSGMENVALNKPVYTSKKTTLYRTYVTDGFCPYLMDAARGDRSQTQLIHINDPSELPTLTLDLQKSQPIHQINLHTASVALSIPMMNFSSWAVPQHVRIAGANRADFSDRVNLCNYKQDSIYDNGPIIMRRFKETTCRYIRVEIIDYNPIISLRPQSREFAFSEIEVLSNNTNIAHRAPITMSSNLICSESALPRITDGKNYYGKILPIRTWMEQLSRRHDLEQKRPLVLAELNNHHERQKTTLLWLTWLAAGLAVGIVITILVARMLQMRHIAEIRARFAADLHDELGADLHTIGLLSDLASEAQENPAKLTRLLNEIRTTTEETGAAVRHCGNMQDAERFHLALPEELKRSAERILGRQEHQFISEGAEFLERLKPRIASDLFLFYKECLINVCKHSGATQLNTHLIVTKKELQLSITDNGCGRLESERNKIPRSLKRRARLLGARIRIANPSVGGTSITLKLQIKS